MKLNERPIATLQSVTPGFFQTLKGFRLDAVEFFADQDTVCAPSVAIIDESLARRFWPSYPKGDDPVGHSILLGVSPQPVRIIGIVADIRQAGLATDAWPGVYRPPRSSLPIPQCLRCARKEIRCVFKSDSRAGDSDRSGSGNHGCQYDGVHSGRLGGSASFHRSLRDYSRAWRWCWLSLEFTASWPTQWCGGQRNWAFGRLWERVGATFWRSYYVGGPTLAGWYPPLGWGWAFRGLECRRSPLIPTQRSRSVGIAFLLFFCAGLLLWLAPLVRRIDPIGAIRMEYVPSKVNPQGKDFLVGGMVRKLPPAPWPGPSMAA